MREWKDHDYLYCPHIRLWLAIVFDSGAVSLWNNRAHVWNEVMYGSSYQARRIAEAYAYGVTYDA